MPPVRYARRAQRDLVRLHEFLAAQDEAAALRAMRTIRDGFAALARMPKTGRPVGNGLRELVIAFGRSGYLALYDFDEDRNEIVVLAIRHQREAGYK